jgi:hypothetical protein
MYDLDILHPDREPAALEVTAAADAQSIELWNLMKPVEGRWQVPTLVGGWAVELHPTARAKRLWVELPALLQRLEEADVRSLRPKQENGVLADLADGLGVVGLFQGGTDYPGSIYPNVDLGPERTGGMVNTSGDPLAVWLGEFLAAPDQSDVGSKLGRSGKSETHAFVLVPGLPTAPFSVIDQLIRDDAPLPVVDPKLPLGVTDVWAASSWSTGCGFRWSVATGWLRFDKRVGA